VKVLEQTYQDSVIKLCISDADFLKTIRQTLKPEQFTSAAARTLIKLCIQFFDACGAAPKQHIEDEIVREALDMPNSEKELLLSYVAKLEALGPPNRNYILKRYSDYVRLRELESASIKFAELLSKEQFVEAQLLMYKALKSGVGTDDKGLVYSPTKIPIRFKKEETDKLMSWGIDDLDKMIGYLKRKKLVCIQGAFKSGKSWFLIHIGKYAMLRGLKVLHISHEMTMEEMEDRYDMAFGSFVSTEEGREIEFFDWELGEDNRGRYIRRREFRPTIFDQDAVKKKRKEILTHEGRLILKKYAMGAATPEEIERYLNQLETFENFTPDVILNDYADLMSTTSKSNEDLRHRLNELYIWHKRVADERNLLMVTASQVRRQAVSSGEPKMDDFAEDIRKAGNIDLGIAIWQNRQQRDNASEEAILYVSANRSGPQFGKCVVRRQFETGQFALWSKPHERQGVEKD